MTHIEIYLLVSQHIKWQVQLLLKIHVVGRNLLYGSKETNDLIVRYYYHVQIFKAYPS